MRMECIGGSVLGRSDGAFFGIYVMSSGHGSSFVSTGRWRMCDMFWAGVLMRRIWRYGRVGLSK